MVEIGPLVLEKTIFYFCQSFFCSFVIISPRKKAGPLISLQPRTLCAKFGWNWLSGSGEDEKVKSLRQQQRQCTKDKLWSEKLTWASHVGELKKKNTGSLINRCNLNFNLWTKNTKIMSWFIIRKWRGNS